MKEQLTSLQAEIQKLRADNLALHDRLVEVEGKAVPQYAGTWVEGDVYPKSAIVTHGGGMWIATADTSQKPGEGETSWTLCVKRAKDGKSAYEIARHHGYQGDEKSFATRLMGPATPRAA